MNIFNNIDVVPNLGIWKKYGETEIDRVPIIGIWIDGETYISDLNTLGSHTKDRIPDPLDLGVDGSFAREHNNHQLQVRECALQISESISIFRIDVEDL